MSSRDRRFCVTDRITPLLTLALLGVLWSLAPGSSEAHPNHGPSLGERYLKLELRDDRLRVVYGLTYAARHGQRVRAQADADGNGMVTAEEERSHGDECRQQVSEAVKLTIDGRVRALAWNDPFLNAFTGPVASGPATIELTTEIPLGPGAHRLVLEDSAEFLGIYRTTTAIVVRDQAELLKAGKGRSPSGRDRRFVFMDLPSPGAPPTRIFTVEARLPGGSALSGNEGRGLVLGIVILLGLAASLLVGVAIGRRRYSLGS